MNVHTDLKRAGNGVEVDISKPYYDSDKTIIQKKLKVAEFSGGFKSFDGGKNYAKVFGRRVFARAVSEAGSSLNQAFGISKTDGLRIIRKSGHLNSINAYNNGGLFRFLEGISDETNISVDELVLALNDGIFFAIGVHKFRDKVLKDLGFLNKGCTVVGLNNGILGQNNDNPVRYSGNNVLVKSVDDKMMVLTMGSPLIWLMGMSKNLAVVVNTLDAFFKGHSIEDGGIPDALIVLNALLSYKTVDEVIEHSQNTKMNVAACLSFADKKGGLVSIEFNADQFIGNIILKPKANQHYLVHTNHPRFSENYLIETWFEGDTGKANSMLANSLWRLEYAENWLKSSSNKTVSELQYLLRSHPVLFPAADNLDFRTTVSVLWNIKEQAAYISPDRPDITEYERVTF